MLEQAMPDTKYFINKMFKEVKTDFIHKKDYLNIDDDYLKGIKSVLVNKFNIQKENESSKKNISQGEKTILSDLSKSTKMKS